MELDTETVRPLLARLRELIEDAEATDVVEELMPELESDDISACFHYAQLVVSGEAMQYVA